MRPGLTPRAAPRLLAFNKPFGVVCQFSAHPGHPSLADFIRAPGYYPAGRLDTDSEGLLLLTDDGALQHRIAAPGRKLDKRYWVQVEGVPDESALDRLRLGLDLGDFTTRPCLARAMSPPDGLWERVPPVRFRKSIPTSWIEIVLTEGKNRQVRRMTAKIGHPTLRLVRHAIGSYSLGDLSPGQVMEVDARRLDKPSRRPEYSPARSA